MYSSAFRPCVRSTISLLVFLVVCATPLLAGGAWIRMPNSWYAKLNATTLSSNVFYTIAGRRLETSDFSTQTIQLYGEYGIISNLQGVVDIPVFKRAAFTTSEASYGPGDAAIELRYGVLTGNYPVAVGIGVELPTGDKQKLTASTIEPGAFINLPTGDGEFNTWLRGYASHSLYPLPAYVSLDAGYNLRTQEFSNQYAVGIQGGYKFLDAVWLTVGVRRLATAGTPNPALLSAIGIGEGVEYTSYSIGAAWELAQHYSLTFDYLSAFGGIRNIYSGSNISIGIAVEY